MALDVFGGVDKRGSTITAGLPYPVCPFLPGSKCWPRTVL